MIRENWLRSVTRRGRTHELNGRVWLTFSGSGIGFEAEGTRCRVRLYGDSTARSDDPARMCARYALYVDGVRVQEGMMTEPERTLTAWEGCEVRRAHVELVKLSESAMSTLAVAGVETDGTLRAIPPRRAMIEFVGDSITCGYGVDTASAEEHFHTANEDVTKAFAWKAAELLDADRSMVSLSGYGIISGWTPDPDEPRTAQLLPLYYEKAGFSYARCDGEAPESWAWDFAQREPDVIVVNLGTNDASYTREDEAKQARFCMAYQRFLVQLRRCNPHAKILCTLGMMNSTLWPAVERAVKAYAGASGDERVETLCLPCMEPETEGIAADYHPSAATHTRIAALVAQRLRGMLGDAC